MDDRTRTGGTGDAGAAGRAAPGAGSDERATERTSGADDGPEAASCRVVEMAPFRLRDGVDEETLKAAAAVLGDDFLCKIPGFLDRQLLKREDGAYVDILTWRSRADAEAAIASAATSETCAAYFALMDLDEAKSEPMQVMDVVERWG